MILAVNNVASQQEGLFCVELVSSSLYLCRSPVGVLEPYLVPGRSTVAAAYMHRKCFSVLYKYNFVFDKESFRFAYHLCSRV